MFHAAIAFCEEIFDRIIRKIILYNVIENGGMMMKKLLVLMMALVMTLSLVACGGDQNSTNADSDITPSSSDSNTEKSIDLVEVTGNGLSFMLPADIKYAKTIDNSGSMIFANDENTAVITLGVLTEDSLTSADITDDVLLAVISAGGALSDGSLESSRTIEHDDGTSVVGFGKATLQNGMVMNSVIQYFFPVDGGYYAISYQYIIDAGNSLEDTIEQVVSSVKTVK